MPTVILEISLSLDGFAAGANVSALNPMGDGGIRLHDWLFNEPTVADRAMLDEVVKGAGAVIVGGVTYHTAIDGAWEGVSPFHVPAFVLTSQVPGDRVGFSFVTGGIGEALKQAQKIAGDKNVWVMGGVTTIRSFLHAGLFDNLIIHLSPFLLGSGQKLFEEAGLHHIQLKKEQVVETPLAIHLKFSKA